MISMVEIPMNYSRFEDLEIKHDGFSNYYLEKEWRYLILVVLLP